MPIQGFNEVFDSEGNLISSTPVTILERVVSDADLLTAKQNLKSYFTQFTSGGVPTGNPTSAQNRNAILSLIVAARYLYEEMDNEV